MKIPVNDLIPKFRRMYEEHWPYVWGAAREGCVDCSGAFVWAYKQFGKSITHGSNAIARSYIKELLPVSKARPGMAAFKKRKPGDKWYDLPAKYREGGAGCNGDLNDYYHIGLVDETGQYVLNAQSEDAGFTRTPISKWANVGYLNAVEYEEVRPMETYVVTADNGLPVRVRDNPNGNTIARLKVGTKVQAGEEDSAGWREVRFGNNETGYMMAKFLKKADATTPTDLKPGFTKTLTQDEYNALCEARDTLIKIVGLG